MSIKWGVLGLGKIADHFCRDLLLIDNCELYAVGSRSIEKANLFGEKHGAKKKYGSYEELISDYNIDIIYIATPHSFHMEHAVQAMIAGKHILCEKPLGINYNQVQKIIETAKDNHVFMMEALWSRFNPSIQKVIESVKQGDIGIPTFINSTFSFQKSIDLESRLFNPELAGGSILDIGIYPVFMSYMIFGMPNSIAATAKLSEQGIDLQMSAMLEYDYSTAQVMSGLLTNCDMATKIYGTEGSIIIPKRWHEAQSYELHHANKTTIYKFPTHGRGYSYEIEECNKCIANGMQQSAIWSHDDSLNLISILDEIRRQTGVVYPFE